ncbi:MAG: ACT domain-containing protein [Agathobacter sp.]|nr:ACT domain-containing protein [Agathobacter sp.]
MSEKTNYFVLKEKAVPEVLLKVVEAKRLFDSGKVASVQDATDTVGISRSSFYKYKDDIFPYHENERGKTFTLVIQLADEPGLLSSILRAIDKYKYNILTIHQSVPINGIVTLTLSIDVFNAADKVEEMVAAIEAVNGVQYAKIMARE